MTNPTRGEVSLTLSGATVTLKMNLNALKRIEAACRKPVTGMMKNLHGGGTLLLDEMFAIIFISGAEGPDAKHPLFSVPAAFNEALYDELGVAGLIVLVTDLLIAGMGGKREEEEDSNPLNPPA